MLEDIPVSVHGGSCCPRTATGVPVAAVTTSSVRWRRPRLRRVALTAHRRDSISPPAPKIEIGSPRGHPANHIGASREARHNGTRMWPEVEAATVAINACARTSHNANPRPDNADPRDSHRNVVGRPLSLESMEFEDRFTVVTGRPSNPVWVCCDVTGAGRYSFHAVARGSWTVRSRAKLAA
jgi:hypothetical protein